MKIPTDNIFNLIHSMSAAEKRYYKRHYASEKSLTTKLFDLVNNMKVYNESSVKKQFGNSNKAAKNLKVYKVQLTDLLLKSLTSYHNKKSIRSKIRMGLEEVEILMDKQLYDLAQNRLLRIKDLCLKFEEFGLLFPILTMETYLSFFYCATEDPDNHPMIENFERYLDILSNVFQLRKINFSLAYKMNNELTHKADQRVLDNYKHFLLKKLEDNDKGNLTISEQYYLNSSLAKLYSITSNDLENELRFKERNITLLENNPNFTETSPKLSFAALHSYIDCCIRYKKWDQVKSGIDKIKTLVQKYPALKHNALFIGFLELKYYYDTKQYKNIVEELETKLLEQMHEFEQEEDHISTLIFIYFVQTHLILDNHKRAHFFLRRLHAIAKNLDSSYTYFFDILELISHYETNDDTVIQHLLASLKRKLKKDEVPNEIYADILDFFKQIIKVDKEEKVTLAKNLKEKLQHAKEEGLTNILNFSIFDQWLDAIINDQNFSQSMLTIDTINSFR